MTRAHVGQPVVATHDPGLFNFDCFEPPKPRSCDDMSACPGVPETVIQPWCEGQGAACRNKGACRQALDLHCGMGAGAREDAGAQAMTAESCTVSAGPGGDGEPSTAAFGLGAVMGAGWVGRRLRRRHARRSASHCFQFFWQARCGVRKLQNANAPNSQFSAALGLNGPVHAMRSIVPSHSDARSCLSSARSAILHGKQVCNRGTSARSPAPAGLPTERNEILGETRISP